MSVSPCFDQFLKSLSKTALLGLRAAMIVVKSQLQVDKAKAVARQLTVGNLKNIAQNAAAEAEIAALQQVKNSMDAFNLGAFKGCPSVDGIQRIMVGAVDNSVGETSDAEYNAAQLELVEKEQKKEASLLDAQSRALGTRIAEVTAEVAQREQQGTE